MMAVKDEITSQMQWERIVFAGDLELMKNRALNLGLYATAQRMDHPIRMVGFEIAGEIERCKAYEDQMWKAKRNVGVR